jgi:hypothetical protein
MPVSLSARDIGRKLFWLLTSGLWGHSKAITQPCFAWPLSKQTSATGKSCICSMRLGAVRIFALGGGEVGGVVSSWCSHLSKVCLWLVFGLWPCWVDSTLRKN